MINVDDKANIRDFIKRKGFSCVYLISCEKGTPTKIGIANDMCQRLAGLQVGNWIKLEVTYIMWCPGRPVSERVESELHRRYESYNIGGEWFNLHYSNIHSEIDNVARILFPSIILTTHCEMIEYARKQIAGRYDRILSRFGLQNK